MSSRAQRSEFPSSGSVSASAQCGFAGRARATCSRTGGRGRATGRDPSSNDACGLIRSRRVRRTRASLADARAASERERSVALVSTDIAAPHVAVIVDDREGRSGLAAAIAARGRDVTVARLDVGDVAIGDRVLVERKSIADFVASVVDRRLFDQAYGRVTARRIRAAGAVPPRSPGSAGDGR
jgi:hypothetical protein